MQSLDLLNVNIPVKYSFVLPAYKGQFFAEALQSITHQSFYDFEVIVVDDCSPDDLKRIVEEQHDNRVRYYRNKTNVGSRSLIEQWNLSLKYAEGEYVILASDDDVYDKDYLLLMDRLISEFPNVNVFRPKVSHIDSNGIVIDAERDLPRVITRDQFLNKFLGEELFSGIPQYIFRRVALLDINGFVDFPLAWFSDDATVTLLSKEGICCSNEAKFYFRKSDIALSSVTSTSKVATQKIHAAIKYYDFLYKQQWMSESIREQLIERVRRQSYYLFKDNNIDVLTRCLGVIHENKAFDLFPMTWRIKAIASFVWNQTVRRAR